jgi:hypothetical protein
MTEPAHPSHDELTPEQQAAQAYARLTPYEKSFEETAPDGEWTNTVKVTTIAVHDPTERPHEEAEWLADYGNRQLVRVDTNYKARRPGEHPGQAGRPHRRPRPGRAAGDEALRTDVWRSRFSADRITTAASTFSAVSSRRWHEPLGPGRLRSGPPPLDARDSRWELQSYRGGP